MQGLAEGVEQLFRSFQARFDDDPNGAVTEADQLLGDVMSTRGYPVSDFEQRTADISVDHPRVVENYRAAHEIALRHSQGQASTEELRQAMLHYRTLFEELPTVFLFDRFVFVHGGIPKDRLLKERYRDLADYRSSLVEERTSKAVKTALDGLLSATAPSVTKQ